MAIVLRSAGSGEHLHAAHIVDAGLPDTKMRVKTGMTIFASRPLNRAPRRCDKTTRLIVEPPQPAGFGRGGQCLARAGDAGCPRERGRLR
jgi:hypothetical protein